MDRPAWRKNIVPCELLFARLAIKAFQTSLGNVNRVVRSASDSKTILVPLNVDPEVSTPMY